jgi:glycosyltransferase involved in cell wall biosynthesis
MNLRNVVFIGNHLPRRCGIATFTHDLHRAVSTARPDIKTGVVAMTDPGHTYDYPAAVRFQINDDAVGEYVKAAEYLNSAGCDVACLQHEFGIFGGEAGGHIVELLSRLKMPIVTTLHTVLAEPSPVQRRVMDRIIHLSAMVVVMSEKGHEFLRSVHRAPARKIEIIPHGIPDFPFLEPHHAKAKLGFAGKSVILTFGLLSPSKGIETVIEAMPSILARCPDAVYVVLGATHPNLVRHQGEAYRESLKARVRELGIEDRVVFYNQFVDQATLLDFISMCDVYATPYRNEAQMTSGTLSYSFGLGKAVVSTPYWHAQELLSDRSGVLVPFGDVEAIGSEIAGLLADDERRHAMRSRAYATSRSMTWPQTAERYVTVFETTRAAAQLAVTVPLDPALIWHKAPTVPDMRIGHFLSLCDSTGMLQHAVHSVADRTHGYCVDDNARALLLSVALANSDAPRLADSLTARLAAFIQHAWNPANGRFRNFMSYERRWLEDAGSEDSHGRTLWALGACALKDTDPSRRRWAASLFRTAMPVVETFRSPRAWAFTLLGLDTFCSAATPDDCAENLRHLLAERLISALFAVETKDWIWFEDVLAYDNGRLPQALIQTGLATRTPAYIEAGLQSLRWLMRLQTNSLGYFQPVGTESFGRRRQKPQSFDQQPVEAAASISACIAAFQTERGAEWPAEAMRAFGWFVGENDLRIPLIDPETGSCSDGLHPDRANENKGAESALSYLLGLVEIRQLLRSTGKVPTERLSRLSYNVTPTLTPEQSPGGLFVSVPILEPADSLSAAGPNPRGRAAVQAGN